MRERVRMNRLGLLVQVSRIWLSVGADIECDSFYGCARDIFLRALISSSDLLLRTKFRRRLSLLPENFDGAGFYMGSV